MGKALGTRLSDILDWGDLVRGVHACASVERGSRETRETSVVICVSRAFCSTDQEKRETARSLPTSKTNLLIFLTNKRLLAGTIHIRFLIYLKAIYEQKMKEIDFSTLAKKLRFWSIFH